MMRGLFTAATGMEAQQVNIDTIANNLANANTTSFKRSRANFHDLLYQSIRTPGQSSTTGTIIPGGIQVGAGSKTSSVDKSFTQGSVRITDRNLDIMVLGEGFFQVEKSDGSIAYTRDGHLSKDNSGRLVTADGFPILPEIIIPSNVMDKDISVGLDGIVSVRVGDDSQEIGRIDIVNFINPTGLVSVGRNLYSTSEASGDPIKGMANMDGFGAISQGQLEASNVNIVEEMVNMITGQRAYEINSKVIQTGDQMLQTTTNIR